MDEYLLYFEEYSLKYGKNNIVILMQVGSFFEIYAHKENLDYLDRIANVLGIRRVRKRGGSDDDDASDEDSDEETRKKKEPVKVKTTRGKKGKQPPEPKRPTYMAGFLCLKIDYFLPKLLDYNYTVIEIRQVQNKQRLKTDEIKREVTKVYTPGTHLVNPIAKESNYLMYLYIEEEYVRAYGNIVTCCGISVVDFSTGEIIVYEVLSPQHDALYALDESLRFINSFVPKEIIICHITPQIINRKFYDDFEVVEKLVKNKSLTKDALITYFELENKNYKYYTTINENFRQCKYVTAYLNKIYKLNSNDIIGHFHLEKKLYALISLLGLIDYVSQRDKTIIDKLHNPVIFKSNRHLLLGNNAVNQLNVIGTIQTNTSCLDTKKITSLFDVVNHTRTPMGQRYLYSLLINPIINIDELRASYDRIDECRQGKFYLVLEELLKKIIDFERYWRKLTVLKIDPYEFLNFYKSVTVIPKIFEVIKESKKNSIISILPDQETINSLTQFIIDFKDNFDLNSMKDASLVDLEKSIFNKEYCEKNDCAKINELQTSIDLETGLMDQICNEFKKYLIVPNSKTKNQGNNIIQIKHVNKVGHYLALSKKKSDILKANLADVDVIKINNTFTINSKKLRYEDTPNGKNTKIFFEELGDKSANVEQLKNELIELLLKQITKLYESYSEKYDATVRRLIKFIVQVDNLQSAAKISIINNYCKPVIKSSDSGYIRAKELRHPIIEKIRTEVEYIPHNISLGTNNTDDNKLDGILIYGLNSSGKSSLMKAIGLSVVMAQCGLYVPAIEYEFSPYDSLFARITGNDNIFKGQSSFTLEMTELDTILSRTGPKTLVIGDEVCRGTEHISGTAIVAATIIELSKTKSTFIFASHLHDIATMEEILLLDNVKAFHLTVEHDPIKDTLIYDRKLKEGPGDTIYGFTVARYIIKNRVFMDLVVNIKNKIMSQVETLCDKKSKYNSNVYMDSCEICGFQNKSDLQHASGLDTHHINFQKDCKDGFVINKPHLPMNNEANLIVLCKDCHHKVHHGELEIKGYVDTIQGKQLDYKFIQNTELNKVTQPELKRECKGETPIQSTKLVKTRRRVGSGIATKVLRKTSKSNKQKKTNIIQSVLT